MHFEKEYFKCVATSVWDMLVHQFKRMQSCGSKSWEKNNKPNKNLYSTEKLNSRYMMEENPFPNE